MSLTLRSAASVFLGMPPIFRKKDADRAMRRGADAAAKPKAQAAKADARVEPTLRVKPAAKPASAAPASNAPQVDLDKLLAATRKAPVDLAIIEWDGDGASTAAIERAQTADAVTTPDTDPRGYDARCRRIRDRYIGARFPGVARSAADLESPERVVKAARLYFEDGQVETALELLDVAIEQDSRAEPLWLAQLELLFLGRNAPRFIECARAFRAMHPASQAWPEVCRLGRALSPRESLFGSACGPRDHDHYGPWPDLPNWIQANWDLTAEVVAADFHRILRQRAQDARNARTKPQLAA